MLFAAHSVVGASTGSILFDNWFLSFSVGFLCHFLLDMIPHYDTTDEGKWTKRQYLLVLMDGIVGLIILGLLLPQVDNKLSFIWGSVGGVFPDLIDNVPFLKDRIQKTKFGKIFHQIHSVIQYDFNNPVLGMLIQYVIIIFVVYILGYF